MQEPQLDRGSSAVLSDIVDFFFLFFFIKVYYELSISAVIDAIVWFQFIWRYPINNIFSIYKK